VLISFLNKLFTYNNATCISRYYVPCYALRVDRHNPKYGGSIIDIRLSTELSVQLARGPFILRSARFGRRDHYTFPHYSIIARFLYFSSRDITLFLHNNHTHSFPTRTVLPLPYDYTYCTRFSSCIF
jgi:hypothetical protein